MRERDLNLVPKEEELSRLKGILFPKKTRSKPASRVDEKDKQEQSETNGVWMRSEIQRLRDEINCMMEKGRARQSHSMETERAYLDGINRLSKGLKNYTSEVTEVFEDFMAHLPTNTLARKNYSNDYYLSMFIQHAIWSRMDGVMRRPIASAFQAMRTAAMVQKDEEERREALQRERQVKFKNRMFSSMGKYFSSWRYNSMCMGVKVQSEEFLKENNLEYDRKIEQNLLNLPLLVLMLEQLGRESADISELLIIGEKRIKICKYLEEGTSLINSNIETVTQRSLFQGSDNPHQKYSRFEFNLAPSLTQLCIERGEILFVSSLSKHPDYSEIDNLCYWQSQGKCSTTCLKGGAIFYPLFNSNHDCIAIFRQYFYDGVIKVVSNGKIEKMCMFLELGASLEKRMRSISRQKEYQREGYYIKMISLIKKVETAKGSEQQAMAILENELREKLGVSGLSIYKVERRESEGLKDILLQNVYGESQECSSLLAMVDQLMKQQSNHVYLENRLLIYSKMMLFDLEIEKQELTVDNTSRIDDKQLLPVELIVNSMSKIQAVLSIKELESRVLLQKEMQSESRKRQEALKELQKTFREKSLELLSLQINSNDILMTLSKYFKDVWVSVDKMAHVEKQSYVAPEFYLECSLGKSKRESTIVKLDASCQQISQNERQQWSTRSINMLKIDLSDSSWLIIDFTLQKEGEHLKTMIHTMVQQFIDSYFRSEQQKKAAEWQPNMFSLELEAINDIELVQSNKKKWQIAHCSQIYQHFNRAVLSFMSSLLKCQDQPIWQRQQPKESNLNEWKQLIYKSAMAGTSLSIDIIHKNPILTVKEYDQIKIITNNRLSLLEQECWLAIGCSKTLFKMKNMSYDGSLLIKIPKYFCFSQEQVHLSSFEVQVKQGLDKLKAIWLKLCRSLLEANSYFTQNQLLTASKKINNWFNIAFTKNLKYVFKQLNKMRTIKEKGVRSLNEFALCISSFKNKQIWQALSKIVAFSRQKQINRVKDYIDKTNISSICHISTKLIFIRSFKSIVALGRHKISVEKGLLQMEKLLQSVDLSTIRQYFTKLVYRSRQKTYSELLIESIRRLYSVKMNSCYNQLVNYSKHVVKYANLNEAALELESCRSLSVIRKQINKRVPLFSLYLSIDEKRCFCLHSPQSKSLSIAQTDEIYNPTAPYIVYQSGTEGQLLWNYSFKEGENCFAIKDKLNYISKCVQAGIRTYKSQMQIKMNILSIFKRAYIRNVKSSNWKKWRQESSRIAMQERNRLNDSLYQISIESQTMKEKLKGQEKTLKNNFGSYQQLKRKQEQYEQSILFSSREVLHIEQSHNKLENTRTLYNTLHRRTVLKSCMLLWRNHSLILKLTQLKMKRKNQLPFFKMGMKSILAIVNRNLAAKIRNTFLQIKHTRKSIPYKSKDVQRLQVSFEDKGARLITFQSEMGDQQNSNHQSNRSASPEPLQSQDSNQGSRFKMDRLKGDSIPSDLSAEQMARYNSGAYKLNPKTLKFLKRMGKLQS